MKTKLPSGEELEFCLSEGEYRELAKKVREVRKLLESAALAEKAKVRVFVGGSFAKRTMLSTKQKEVDVFLMYSASYSESEISRLHRKIVLRAFPKGEWKIEKIKGSRDYFQVARKDKREVVFEVVPTLGVRKPERARNVMDLSYFHVRYVLAHTDEKMRREICLAKQFCKANGFYGAESHVSGFSGYALECLIIHYKSFEKMLRDFVRAKEKIVIDIEKHYASRNQVLQEMNASKIAGPVVLVDPTWKERNVLAALSKDTFEEFRKLARKFLRNPSRRFFEEKEFSLSEFAGFAKKGFEVVEVEIATKKKRKDIAAAKLKKFYKFLLRVLAKKYEIARSEFVQNGETGANVYLALKPLEFVVVRGPLVKFQASVEKFKAKHAKTFLREGRVFARERFGRSVEEYL
ncbi:hypothetical protein D6817_04150, partial [Candidatus Pacearchaeota archaeon]